MKIINPKYFIKFKFDILKNQIHIHPYLKLIIK